MAVSIITAALFIVGFFLILGISLKSVFKDIWEKYKKPSTMKKMCRHIDGKGGNFITKKYDELHDMLILTGREKEYERYVFISICFAIGGATIAAIFENILLIPILTLLGLFIPVIIAFVTTRSYTQAINNELQVSMEIVTVTYSRTENILSAVSENIEYFHEPIRSVFNSFLGECKFMTSNTEKAIYRMKSRIKNEIWQEWCEALVLCQHDRANIDMLEPIVKKMKNVDLVQTELNSILYKPVRDFVVLVVLVLSNFPIIYFLNKTWWSYLFTLPGQIAVAFCFLTILISLLSVMKAIKPIEYKR